MLVFVLMFYKKCIQLAKANGVEMNNLLREQLQNARRLFFIACCSVDAKNSDSFCHQTKRCLRTIDRNLACLQYWKKLKSLLQMYWGNKVSKF